MTETSKRKKIMLGLVIVCFAISGAILLASMMKSTKSKLDVFADQEIWVKCVNPSCGAEYEVNKKWYFSEMEKKGNPMLMESEGVLCEKCTKLTAFQAVKCPKCENVFIRGAIGPRDFPDRCPKCKFSQSEADRKAAQ